MADSKITALTNLTAADPVNDMLPIVDVSDTIMAASGTTKRISVNNILGASGTATLASATITGALTAGTTTLVANAAGYTGKVGIGTATPAAPLDIQGTTNRLQVQSSSNGAYATWRFIGKTSAGAAVSFEHGVNIAADNAFELYDTQNSQLVSRYVNTGTHSWFLSGTTAMTLNSTGLGVGASPSFKFHVAGAPAATSGSLIYVRDTTANGSNNSLCSVLFSSSPGTDFYIGKKSISSVGSFSIGNSGTGVEYLGIDASGNVGVGVTPSYKLHVAVTSGAVGAFRATTAAIARLLVGNTVEDVELKVNANGDGQLTANASKYLGLGSGGINDRVVLDTSGNLLVNVPTTAPTLATNSQMVFNLTSNTNLRISVRGTDGTTRTANITLA
jgi:hypothetical protein